MSLALVRVDDRMLHGQVVVGWGRALGIRRVVLVDDTVAETPWEQELYRFGVPDEMDVLFLGVADAAGQVSDWRRDGVVTGIVVGTVDALVRLCELSDVRKANLGGLHHRPDRRERLPYVFLSDGEADALRALAGRGIAIAAQDVPTARPVPLEDLL